MCGRHHAFELGGKNPLVVMADAQLDLAAEGALFSGFGTAGQRCTSLGTVIVHESVHDEFMRRLGHGWVKVQAIGDPFEDVLYGPMIHERFSERFEDWLGLIRDHHTVSGSTTTGRITTDNPREGFVGDPDAGIFCHPTIVDGVTADDEIAAPETFGPIVGVATFSDFDEAMELANGHGYGLSAAIYTPPMRARPSIPASGSAPGWSRSTTPPAGPRPTFRSEATASRATARASRACGCWTSSRAGSR